MNTDYQAVDTGFPSQQAEMQPLGDLMRTPWLSSSGHRCHSKPVSGQHLALPWHFLAVVDIHLLFVLHFSPLQSGVEVNTKSISSLRKGLHAQRDYKICHCDITVGTRGPHAPGHSCLGQKLLLLRWTDLTPCLLSF